MEIKRLEIGELRIKILEKIVIRTEKLFLSVSLASRQVFFD